MNSASNFILTWINERSSKERVLTLLIAYIFTYIIWQLSLENPSILKQKQLTEELRLAKDHILNYNSQTQEISDLATKQAYVHKLAQQKGLSTEKQSLKQQLENMIPHLVSAYEFQKLTKILLTQHNEIELISLRKMPDVLWKPAGLMDIQLSKDGGKIYKQSLEISLRGKYFNIMAYLNWLENLPWHIYWDSLEYKVYHYPEAETVVKFHLLSNQKS